MNSQGQNQSKLSALSKEPTTVVVVSWVIIYMILKRQPFHYLPHRFYGLELDKVKHKYSF